MKYGGQFNKPTQKEKRQNRSARDRLNGKRLFAPKEIKTLVDNSQQPLKAMILLGINGGFGNTDCAVLPVHAFDLKQKIIDYERPKTAVQRVVPLWPETVTALREVLNGDWPKARKPEYENLVFLNVFGNPWSTGNGCRLDGLTNRNRKIATTGSFDECDFAALSRRFSYDSPRSRGASGSLRLYSPGLIAAGAL